MPGKFLHRGCVFQCVCGAAIPPPPTTNTILKVRGQLVYLATDTFPVPPSPTCLGNNIQPPQPCTAVVWDAASRSRITKVGGQPVLLQVAGAGRVGPAIANVLAMQHNTVTVTDPETPIKEA